MKKLFFLSFLFVAFFSTRAYALDFKMKTETTLVPETSSLIKISTTTSEEPVLQNIVRPEPITIPIEVTEPEEEEEDDVPLPSKIETVPEQVTTDNVKLTPTLNTDALQTPPQDETPKPTPIVDPIQETESVIPIKKEVLPETLAPDTVLPEKEQLIITPSESGAGAIFNSELQTIHAVQLRVQEGDEESDKPIYDIEPTQWNIEYSSDATGTKEIITVPLEKSALFKVKEKQFTVDDNQYNYEKLIGSDDDYRIGIDLKTSSSSKTSHFAIQPQNDCLTLYFGDTGEKKIDVCDDLETEPDGAYLSSGAQKFKLKTNPDLVHQAVKESTEKEDAIVGAGSLSIHNDTPVYEFEVTEKHKLFWVIPINMKGKLQVNAEDDSMLPVQYPWYGVFFEDKDYSHSFKFAPNLVFETVATKPQSVHMGDKVTFIATIKNIGTYRSSALFTSEKGPSSLALYLADDIEIDTADTGFFIDPGESVKIPLEWSAVLCNAPVKIVIDPKNIIEEVHEDDNTWTWSVACAPTDAPDLEADPITYSNNYKRIGAQNTVHFTFRNTGTQPSPEHTSFYKYDNLSSSIVVPPIAPGKSWSTTRTVTPKNCDSIELELDPANTVVEYQEENNLAYEHPSIIESCNRRADLLISSVWWVSGGYTSGDIHAGEEIWFEYTVKNDPITWSNHDACLSGFKVSLKRNGTVVKSENLGWIGCVDDYAYNLPDYWRRKGHFTYVPECNGEKLTIEVDPNNTVSEGKENNNTWSFDIMCTAPAPTLGN